MKTKKNNRIILLGILLALVLFGGVMAVQHNLQKKYEMAEAITASKEVPAGTEITKENAKEYFGKKEVLKSTLNKSVVTREKDLYGAYTAYGMKKGTLVYEESLRKDDEETKNISDPVEVSVSLNNISDGVSGTIRKGDYVYIYFTDVEDGTVGMYGTEPVYVKQSFSGSGEPIEISDKQTAASVFTVVIERTMSAEFCALAQRQNITFARTANTPMTQEDSQQTDPAILRKERTENEE